MLPRRKNKRPLLIGLAVVLPVLVASIYIIISRLSAPAQGTLLNPAIVSDTQSKQLLFDFTPKTITGAYAAFTIPISLVPSPKGNLVGPVVEVHNFMFRDTKTWNLAITVLHIASGKLSDNSSYMFAKAHPDIYTEAQTTMNGRLVTVVTDKSVGGFEKFAIIQNGGYQAVISLLGDDASGTYKLQTTFNMIINSWQWLAT